MRRWMVGALAASLVLPSALAHAVCRVIEPPRDSPYPAVGFDATTSILYVLEGAPRLGYQCAEGTVPDPTCADGSTGVEVIGEPRVHFAVQPRLVPRWGRAALIMPVPHDATISRGASTLMQATYAASNDGLVLERITFVEDPSLGVQCTDPHYYGRVLGATMPCDPSGNPSPPAAIDAGPWSEMSIDAGTMTDAGWTLVTDAGSDPSDAGPTSMDAGAIPPEDAAMADAGAPAVDSGPVDPPPDDLPAVAAIPVVDEYELEVVPGLTELENRLDALGLSPRAADLDALASYEGTHDFVLVIVEPSERPGVPLVALRPIVATWAGDEMPYLERAQYDPFGGFAFTQAFVVGPDRAEREDLIGDTVFANEVVLPSELAEIAGATQGWLTRIDVTRQIDRVVADTKMVRSADSAVVEMPSILREQRVLIASACCPAGTIPDAPRSFVVERIYPVDDPPSTDTLFYCAPPPEPSQCDGVPDGPPSTPLVDSGVGDPPPDPPDTRPLFGCSRDPGPPAAPAPPPDAGPPAPAPASRSGGCCGGRCSIGRERGPGLGSVIGALSLLGFVFVRSRRRRG